MIEGLITKPSSYSVLETLERLQNVMQRKGLHIFAQIDHSGEAKKAGLEMRETHVLIFGSPKAGTPLMVAVPLFALELPLKVLVWEGSDGCVWVSYTGVAYLAARYSLPTELANNIAAIDLVVDSALRG